MKEAGLPWPYEVRESDQDIWEVNLAAHATKGALDCRGKDSGLSTCWPAAINISVPIACCAVFLVVLTIIYVISKPKPSPSSSSSSQPQQDRPTSIRPMPTNNFYQNPAVSTDTLASIHASTMTSQYNSSDSGTVSIAVEMDPSLMTKL